MISVDGGLWGWLLAVRVRMCLHCVQIATEDSVVCSWESTRTSSVRLGADGIETALPDAVALDSSPVISRVGHPVK